MFSGQSWRDLPEYPFGTGELSKMPIMFVDGSFYIFGGYRGEVHYNPTDTGVFSLSSIKANSIQK